MSTLTHPLQHICGKDHDRRVTTDALEDHEGTVSIGGRTTTNLRFAGDSDAHFRRSPVIDRLKSKRPIVPNPLRTFVRLKYSSDGIVSYCFYGEAGKPAIISQQNLSLGSVQRTDVLTSAPGPQRHHVMAGVNGHV